jgi:hypothetical protein
MNSIANGNSSPTFAPNQVPIFEPNQVLKNTDLNSIVTYLDSQNRLTRTHLIGIGIVCGLEVQLLPASSEIRFTPGCGITSEGFIVEYLLATGENATDLNRFTHYREEPIPKNRIITTDATTENFQLQELISAEEVKKPNDRNIPLSTIDLTQKVVMILCYWDDVGRDSCLVDCDGRGRDRNFRLRFFLIDKSNTNSTILSAERLLKTGFEIEAGVSLGSAFQSWFEVPDCQIDRLDTLDNIQNFNDLMKAYYRVCKAGILSIDLAFTQTAKLFNPFLSTFQPTDPVFTNIQARLKEILIALVPIDIPNADPFAGDTPPYSIGQIQSSYGIQYFYDYLVELIAAFDELKAALFDLMDECPPNMQWFPKYLLAGAVVTSIEPCAPPDIYRHSFYQPPIYNGNHQRKREVHHLYDRLVQMITKFQLLPFYQTPVKITPSRIRQAQLGAQAIPFYYAYPDIYPYWNYDACRKQRAAQLPAYFRLKGLSNQRGYDLTPRIDWADFFRVEGHVGLPLTTAIDRINRSKNDFNLAFDLVAMRVGAGIEDPNLLQGYFDDLEVEFDLIKADWQQKYDRAKKTFGENSDVLKILENFDRYFFQYSDLTKIDPGLMQNDFLRAAQDPINYEFRPIRRAKNALQLVLNILTATPFRTALVTVSIIGSQIERSTRFVLTDANFREQNKTHIREIFANEFTADTTTLGLELDGNNLRVVINNGSTDIELLGTDRDLPNLLIRLEDETPYNIDTLLDRYHDFDALFAFLQYFGEIGKILTPGAAAKLVSYYEFRALFHRYLLRLAAVKKMQLLTEYAKHHRGLEHLGGVPNGGTLVLVYTSDPKVISNLIASDAALIETSDRQANTIQAQAQFPLDRLLPAQRLPAITNDRIGQNVVIADFCLPYLCCSPYSSLNYIVSKPKPFISLPKPVYCEGDTNIYDFILDPPGGLLKGGDGIVDRNGNYAFQPSAVDADVTEPMNLTFFYVVDGVGSSYSILLLPHADVTLSIGATENPICVLPGESNLMELIGNPSGGKFKLLIDDSSAQDISVTDDQFDLGSIIFPADKDSLKLRFVYTVPNTDDYCGGTSNPKELVVIRKPIAKINYQKDEGGRAIGDLIYGEDCSMIGRKIDFNNNGSNGEKYQWKFDNNEVSTEKSISIVIPYSSTSSTITLIARKFHAGERVCKTEKTETIELAPLNPQWSFDSPLTTKTNEDGTTQFILCRIGRPNSRQELITVEQPGGKWSQPENLKISLVNSALSCKDQKQYMLDFTSTPAGTYTLTYTLPDGSSFPRQVEVIVVPQSDFELTVEPNLQIPDRFVINVRSDRSQHPELTYTWTIQIGGNISRITQKETTEFFYSETRFGDPISVVMEIKDPNSYCVFTSKPKTANVPMQVIRFELYQATIIDLPNNVVWQRISTNISNQNKIIISKLAEVNLNIRAVTIPDRVGSVVFQLQAPGGQILPLITPDNKLPYDLYRNPADDTQAVGWRPRAGSYTITATPYQLADGKGIQGKPLKVAFTLEAQVE